MGRENLIEQKFPDEGLKKIFSTFNKFLLSLFPIILFGVEFAGFVILMMFARTLEMLNIKNYKNDLILIIFLILVCFTIMFILIYLFRKKDKSNFGVYLYLFIPVNYLLHNFDIMIITERVIFFFIMALCGVIFEFKQKATTRFKLKSLFAISWITNSIISTMIDMNSDSNLLQKFFWNLMGMLFIVFPVWAFIVFIVRNIAFYKLVSKSKSEERLKLLYSEVTSIVIVLLNIVYLLMSAQKYNIMSSEEKGYYVPYIFGGDKYAILLHISIVLVIVIIYLVKIVAQYKKLKYIYKGRAA